MKVLKSIKDNLQQILLSIQQQKDLFFQVIASLVLPAFVIHSTVSFGKKIFAQVQKGKYLRWGPTILGLGVVPLLPFVLDPPVEYCLEKGKELLYPHEEHGLVLVINSEELKKKNE